MILITGSNGWLGLNLVQALIEGAAEIRGLKIGKIRCLILPGSGSERLKKMDQSIEIVEGDLRNPRDLSNFMNGAKDGPLLHAAGMIHPKRVREFYEINRDGTRNLLEQAALAGLKRAVIVSSNSPCGCNPHPDHRFDENSPYHPYMNYGRSKMEMEHEVMKITEEGALETVLIRAPWFYGPEQPPRQKLFFEMIRNGKVPIVGDGENLRSMAYTGNLVQGLLLAAVSEKACNQIYWIADERPYSMNEIIDTIERLLEEEFGQACAHKRIRLPSFVSGAAELVDAGLQLLGLYHQKFHVLSEMNKTIACDVSLARSELEYEPEVSLEEGMRRSLAEIYSPDPT